MNEVSKTQPSTEAEPPEAAGEVLAIDIGGSHIKASVLDRTGGMAAPPLQMLTPHPAPPQAVLDAILDLVAPLPGFDCVSVGFPGYVRQGRIHTAPNLGTSDWRGFDLARTLAKRLGKPVRVLNDADVQGLGVIEGKGLECVLTLGTGMGSALFRDGALLPHLELGQHPVRKGKTYDLYIGDAVLRHKGIARWSKRLLRVIANYDLLHLGGGNARLVDFELPPRVRLASNQGAITGGFRLWEPALDSEFSEPWSQRGGRG
jgi:polyphosphate glucokinase